MEDQYSRERLLIGKESLERLFTKKVIVFGLGGVGGQAVEALVRGGIQNITLVDGDVFDITNLNRQIMATRETIGQEKTLVTEARIRAINPDIEVTTISKFIKRDNLQDFQLADYDYILDCIDDLSAKQLLITFSKESNVPIICAMGTGNKLDPTRFRVLDISQTSHDPLAKTLRVKLKKLGIKKVKVVSSDEPVQVKNLDPETNRPITSSVSFVPGVVGMIMAGEVIKELIRER